MSAVCQAPLCGAPPQMWFAWVGALAGGLGLVGVGVGVVDVGVESFVGVGKVCVLVVWCE